MTALREIRVYKLIFFWGVVIHLAVAMPLTMGLRIKLQWQKISTFAFLRLLYQGTWHSQNDGDDEYLSHIRKDWPKNIELW